MFHQFAVSSLPGLTRQSIEIKASHEERWMPGSKPGHDGGCHSGMVRRTRPGISRFRVRCFASPRNDGAGSMLCIAPGRRWLRHLLLQNLREAVEAILCRNLAEDRLLDQRHAVGVNLAAPAGIS